MSYIPCVSKLYALATYAPPSSHDHLQFGRGDHGRLGYGRKVTTGHPMEVPINLPVPKNSTAGGRWRAKFVACGGRHTLAVAEWVNE